MSKGRLVLILIFVIGVIFIQVVDDPVLEASIILTAICIGIFGFIFGYGSKSSWGQTNTGRSIMYLAGALFIVLAQILASTVLENYYGKEVIVSYTYLIVLVALANFELVRYRINREVKRKTRELEWKIIAANEELEAKQKHEELLIRELEDSKGHQMNLEEEMRKRDMR